MTEQIESGADAPPPVSGSHRRGTATSLALGRPIDDGPPLERGGQPQVGDGVRSGVAMERHRSIGSQVAMFAGVAFVFGITFGVTGVNAGLGTAKIVATSMMFAGAAQFAVLAIVSTGGAAAAAFVAAMLLNARYGLLGLAVARRLKMGRAERLLAAVVLGDPGVVLALTEGDDDRRDRVYWITGLWTATGWLSGTLVGALSGTSIGDPGAIGLDAALPVLLLAILGQHFRQRDHILAAASGALIGILLVPVGPTGLPVLAGGLGALLPLALKRRARFAPGDRAGGSAEPEG